MTWVEKVSKRSDIRAALAFLATGFTFCIVIMILFRVIPKENHDIANIAVGALLANLQNTYSYYFGSSKTENDKKKPEE